MMMLKKYIVDESAGSAIEYALIAGLISVGILTALVAIGTSISRSFNSVSSGLN